MQFATGEIFARHGLSLAITARIKELETLPGSGFFHVLQGRGGVGYLGGEKFGGIRLAQSGESKPHDDRSAENERCAPDQICPGTGLQATDEHIDCGRDANDPATDSDRTEIKAE